MYFVQNLFKILNLLFYFEFLENPKFVVFPEFSENLDLCGSRNLADICKTVDAPNSPGNLMTLRRIVGFLESFDRMFSIFLEFQIFCLTPES